MVAAEGQDAVRDKRGQEQPGGKKRAQQSQMEGPAAYAPHEGEPASGDEAQKHRETMQRQVKTEGD
jgi:hypothetical protein